jgi:hypothetical protein
MTASPVGLTWRGSLAEETLRRENETGCEAALIACFSFLAQEWLVCIRAPLGSIQKTPFASGGAALPSGRKLLFKETISVKCELARSRSQEKNEQCIAPDPCIGAGFKMALNC